MAYVLQRKQGTLLQIAASSEECAIRAAKTLESTENVVHIGTALGQAAKNLKEQVVQNLANNVVSIDEAAIRYAEKGVVKFRMVNAKSKMHSNMMAMCA